MKSYNYLNLFIFLMTFVFGSCSRFLYTQDEWSVLERDIEAVEEEIDDIQKDSLQKQKELDAYVKQIDEMEKERKLYDQAIQRIREGFLQDLSETSRRMTYIYKDMNQISSRSTKYSTSIHELLLTFETKWVEQFSKLLKSYCAHWECEGEGSNEKIKKK